MPKGVYTRKPMSKEHKEKIKLSLLGYKVSDETRKKLKESCKKGNSTTFRKGHIVSKKTKTKISNANMGWDK